MNSPSTVRTAKTIPQGSSADPVTVRMPRSEMERRWDLARRHMEKRKLDAVIAVGFDDSLSGMVRWLCDFGALAYMKVAIFFAHGPMTVVEHGALGGVRETSPDNEDTPGVARILQTAAFKSVAGTLTLEAEATGDELRRRGALRVGLLRPGAMPHGFVTHLRENLPKVEWTDETDAFDSMKAVKSSVELDSLRDACRIQDEVFAKILSNVRPGVREVELLALAEHELRLRGAIDGIMASASARIGTASGMRSWRAQNRVLQKGDCFTILIEMSNAAGYYGELARQVVLGKMSADQKAALGAVRDAQAAIAARLRPGASCAALAEENDRILESRGYQRESRLFAHGQGYDLVERPLIRKDETMSLEAGMFLACHPAVATPSLFVFLCDNYIVHENRPAERLHTTPSELFEV